MTKFVQTSLLTVGTLFIFIVGGIFITHLAKAQTSVTVNGATYNSVHEALEFTLPSDRGTVKGEQISKIQVISKIQRGDYWIEVTDMKARNNGVEVFAKAWDKNNNQIGFGVDGTVEIERFVIINPPILVPDPNGTIVRSWTDKITNEVVEVKYREDLQEALLQTLERILAVKQQKYGPSYIIQGKIGNTTTTIYPDGSPESTSVDGETGGANTTWSTVRSATDASSLTNGFASDGAAGSASPQVLEFDAEGGYLIYRSLILFDASSISASDEISSATLTLTSNGSKIDGDSTTFNVSSAQNIGSNTAVATTDFDAYAALTPSAGQIFFSDTIANWVATVGTDNNLSLDSDGVSFIDTAVNGDGIVKFMMRLGLDTGNTAPSNETQNLIRFYFADQSGTTDDPTLVIEHSLAPPVLSNLQTSNISASQVTITWTTDLSSDSEVTYDTTSPVTLGDPSDYDSTATTSHTITLSGLSANTTYYYFASSTASGATGTSTESSFATSAFDLSNIRATNVGSGWTDIKWDTSTAADSKVWYSLTSPVSATNFTEVYDATATTTHSLYLSGLLHNAIYYYIVTSDAGSGDMATSTEKQFNTTSQALCEE